MRGAIPVLLAVRGAVAVLLTALLCVACGGTDVTIEGDAAAGDGGGSGSSDAAAVGRDAGGGGRDGAADGGAASDGAAEGGGSGDGAACVGPSGTCGAGCPTGSVCVFENGIVLRELGCAPVPPGCDGTCKCMAACVCGGADCHSLDKGLSCGGG